MRRGVVTLVAAAALLIIPACLLPASALAVDYAPVDQPGPALSVPQADLDAALVCTGNVQGASRAPVLLVHGTGSNPDDNFSWNYEPAFDDLGIPWCTVALPGNGMDDIQVAGEYVVNAIRTMYADAGRKISIVGHSQGGMIPRWPLRFWPDTRSMVDDVIGFAPSNHGTDGANLVCNPDCAAADWQQASGSEFIKAINSNQETFAGISYTVAYTHTDWVVTPNQDAETGSSSLRTGDGEISNVAIQDICPLDLNEHLAIGTQDPVAYALAIDALDHPGPADPSRIDPAVCTQGLMPGIDPVTFPTNAATAAADLAVTTATYPHVPAEPPLKCYVTASCPSSSSVGEASASGGSPAAVAGTRKAKHKRKCGKHKRRRCHRK
jgi:pimeloyl-ACP methyl ester carboxylesterase